MIEYFPNIYKDIILTSNYTPPSDGVVDVSLDRLLIDVSGGGVLSSNYPNAIVTDKGVPTSSLITITLRCSFSEMLDGLVVARTTSAQDGTWLVGNLNQLLSFNVISSKLGRNDVIVSDVNPV